MAPSEAWDAGYYDELERLGYRFAEEDSNLGKGIQRTEREDITRRDGIL